MQAMVTLWDRNNWLLFQMMPYKRPMKLIQPVKIPYSFLHVISKLFHPITVSPRSSTYTPLTKLSARWARLSRTHSGSGNHAEKYSSISATNQRQISSKIYQWNLQSFFV